MSITSTNIPATDRSNSWGNVDGNPEVTHGTQGASFVDPLKEGLIGKSNSTHNNVLDAPNNTAGDVQSTIDALGRLNAENLGSDNYDLLRLLHKCSLEQRTGARMVRQSETQASINAQNSAAKEIRESAFQRMMGGIAAGALQIASAGVQAYSATQSLKSISSLKDAASTNSLDPTKTENAVDATGDISKEIAVPATSSNALIERPLAPSTGADGANAIAAESGAKQMVVADSNASRRSIHVDDQGTLTVRDPKGNETLRIEIIGEATDATPVPVAVTPPASDASINADAQVAEPTDRELALKELDFQAARLKAASEMAQASGNVLNAFAQNSAASHDAEKAELEATAKVHDMASHQASDEIQQTLEQARSWRDILQGIEQNNVETNRGISRHI